jgi:hypothetical protein
MTPSASSKLPERANQAILVDRTADRLVAPDASPPLKLIVPAEPPLIAELQKRPVRTTAVESGGTTSC